MPFKPGQSGNPGGRPRIPDEAKEAARALTKRAIKTLAEVMEHGDTSGARVRAAEAILNRAWGTPESESRVSIACEDRSSMLRALTDAELVALSDALRRHSP